MNINADKDFYSILGIDKDATEDEIKKAYRKKAMEFHPDKNAGNKEAEENFKAVAEAYEVLGDANNRARYDNLRGTRGGFGGGFNGFGGFGGFGGFEDFMNGFHTREERVIYKGNDLNLSIAIDLKESYFGHNKIINFSRNVSCKACSGSGAKETHSCTSCGGLGKKKNARRYGELQMFEVSMCQDCHGTGKKVLIKCDDCNGAGYETKSVEEVITLPRGIMNNMRIKYQGKGDDFIGLSNSNEIIPGDLLVTITIKPVSGIEIVGEDVFMEENLKFKDFVFGTKLDVDTISGDKLKVNIEAGSKVGKKLRLKGFGMPKLDIPQGVKCKDNPSYFGDLYINLDLNIPNHQDLTEEQKENIRNI